MTAPTWQYSSSVPGVVWPGVPDHAGATRLAVLHQLEQSQWWSAERLRDAQFRQLVPLLQHAASTVPFYRERLAAAGYRSGMTVSPGWFEALPCLARVEVREAGEALFSNAMPAAHAPAIRGQTSGSTGIPITFLATGVSQLFWQAFTLRDHLWHRRDLSLRLATIRPERGVRDEAGETLPNWGISTADVAVNGPAYLLHSALPLERQIAWLVQQDPDYLLTLASNLLELTREMQRRGIHLPRLREARTYGDVLSAQARAECSRVLGVRVVDIYSAQEAGYLALQCPEADHYHVQAEGAIVELLDDHDRPCGPGQVGRVVVTTLHNFAMPLIRYEIGDYAEAGAPCACGRGLPVIRRILGRERNLAVTPDGSKFYPSFAAEVWSGIAPIRQIQLVQKSRTRIEVRLAMPRALSEEETRRLDAALHGCLGHPYEFTFTCMDSIPRSPGGKYEDFVAELEA